MKYADMRGIHVERATLLGKKRLGKNQKARLAQLSDQLDAAKQPPAAPLRERTGLDEHGQSAADSQGNVYRMHVGRNPSQREVRRANRFGRGGIHPLRSRIQRSTRKRRTGGVK